MLDTKISVDGEPITDWYAKSYRGKTAGFVNTEGFDFCVLVECEDGSLYLMDWYSTNSEYDSVPFILPNNTSIPYKFEDEVIFDNEHKIIYINDTAYNYSDCRVLVKDMPATRVAIKKCIAFI